MATATAAPPPPPPPPPPPAQPRSNFVFINDTNPEDAKSKAKRKLVRAQAARGPHSAVVSVPNSIDKPRNGSTLNKHQALKRGKKDRASTTFPLSLDGLEDLGPRPSKPVEKPSTTNDDGIIVQVDDKGLEPEAVEPQETTAVTKSSLTGSTALSETAKPSNDEESPSSRSTASLVTRNPGTGWAAPFISHPDPEKTYIPMLIDHYLKNMALKIPELDAGSPYILRTKWFPMAMTSPAMFYIVLLTAASHYAAFNSFLPRPRVQQILLHLKQETLVSVNTLIRNSKPSEPMNDTIIGAVAKMASYEAMFGSKTLYNTHMRGLQNMVKGRGGLEKLGLDGLMMRMILWIDINSAFIHNTKTYFLPSEPLAGHVAMPEPNPGGFLCQHDE